MFIHFAAMFCEIKKLLSHVTAFNFVDGRMDGLGNLYIEGILFIIMLSSKQVQLHATWSKITGHPCPEVSVSFAVMRCANGGVARQSIHRARVFAVPKRIHGPFYHFLACFDKLGARAYLTFLTSGFSRPRSSSASRLLLNS